MVPVCVSFHFLASAAGLARVGMCADLWCCSAKPCSGQKSRRILHAWPWWASSCRPSNVDTAHSRLLSAAKFLPLCMLSAGCGWPHPVGLLPALLVMRTVSGPAGQQIPCHLDGLQSRLLPWGLNLSLGRGIVFQVCLSLRTLLNLRLSLSILFTSYSYSPIIINNSLYLTSPV